MTFRRLLFLGLLATSLAGCSWLDEEEDDDLPRPVDTGVRGVVLRGPIVPACAEPDPCEDEPFAAEFGVTRDGRPVTTFRSGDDGTFEVALAPGTYRVTPGPDAPILSPSTQFKDVTVTDGALTDVEWHFDTGIR